MADLFDRFSGSAGALAGHTADSGDTWTDIHSLMTLSGSGSVTNSGTGTDGFNYPTSSWTPPGTDYAVKMVVGADYPAIATRGSSAGFSALPCYG